MEEQHAPPPRVAIVDAERTTREALARALQFEGVPVAATAATGEELLGALGSSPAEVALVDVPGETEPALLRALRSCQPSVSALVLGDGGELGRAERSYRDGATGFLSKQVTGMDDLLAAIRLAARGALCFPWGDAPPPPSVPGTNTAVSWKLQRLTPRERQVLAHVAAGHDNLKIAALLNISERTVKSHVISVYRKLDAENRVQLALLAGQLGVTPVRM